MVFTPNPDRLSSVSERASVTSSRLPAEGSSIIAPKGLFRALESEPGKRYIWSGSHRAAGETTKPTERSPVPTRDRLLATRGLKTLRTGQRFFEGFEYLRTVTGSATTTASLPKVGAFSTSRGHTELV